MGFKDIIILILIIAIIGAVLFGSLGNFLGFVTGILNGVNEVVHSNEGYVYRGGNIADYVPQDNSNNINSQGSTIEDSNPSDSGGSDSGGSNDDSAGNAVGFGNKVNNVKTSNEDKGSNVNNATQQKSSSNNQSSESNSQDSSILDRLTSFLTGSSSSQNSDSTNNGSSSSSYPINTSYEDYQQDYMTDMVDEYGKPIYLSIVSTKGGQSEPGIYEVYWSENGPINQTRVG